MIKEKIQKLSEQYLDEFIQIRRYLHSHPELSFKEHETSFFILSWLENLGWYLLKWQIQALWLQYMEKKRSKSNLKHCSSGRYRCPSLNEMNNIPYKSRTENVMHACGHDAHTASLLGTAKF